MRKATTWKGAAAAATIAALLYGGSGVYRSMQDATFDWFPLLMALMWLLIAGLFYQRGRAAERHE